MQRLDRRLAAGDVFAGVAARHADAADHFAVDLDRPAADEDREPTRCMFMMPNASWPGWAFVYVWVGRRWHAAVNALLIAISTLVGLPLSGRLTTIGQPAASQTQTTVPHAELGRLGERRVDRDLGLVHRQTLGFDHQLLLWLLIRGCVVRDRAGRASQARPRGRRPAARRPAISNSTGATPARGTVGVPASTAWSSTASSQSNRPAAAAAMRSPHSTRTPTTSSHTTAAHRATTSAPISHPVVLRRPDRADQRVGRRRRRHRTTASSRRSP